MLYLSSSWCLEKQVEMRRHAFGGGTAESQLECRLRGWLGGLWVIHNLKEIFTV